MWGLVAEWCLMEDRRCAAMAIPMTRWADLVEPKLPRIREALECLASAVETELPAILRAVGTVAAVPVACIPPAETNLEMEDSVWEITQAPAALEAMELGAMALWVMGTAESAADLTGPEAALATDSIVPEAALAMDPMAPEPALGRKSQKLGRDMQAWETVQTVSAEGTRHKPAAPLEILAVNEMLRTELQIKRAET
jgi:hypothetical protein